MSPQQPAAPQFDILEPRLMLSGTTEYDITFTLENARDISLVVADSNGAVLREFMRKETMPAGTHIVKWDGLDYDGNAVDPGSYTWKLLETDGLTAEYAFNLGSNSPSAGHRWVGDHGGPSTVAIDSTGLYFGSGSAEGAYVAAAISSDGSSVLWEKHQYYSDGTYPGGHGPVSMASNGTDVFGLIDYDGTVRVYRNTDGWNHKTLNVMYNDEAPVDMDVVGSEMVLVYAGQNLVRWVDTSYGMQIGSATVTNPTAVTMVGSGADGVVLVASESNIVSLARSDSTPQTRISTIESPGRIDVDHTTGDIFVVDSGNHQVKRYNSSYQRQQTYGQAGGRSFGLYDGTNFLDVADVAADGNGGFYVVENGPLRRTALIDVADGSVGTEYYGGMQFYAQVSVDPVDPTNVWADTANGYLVQYNVDYSTNSWTIQATYQYGGLGDGLFPRESAYSGKWEPISIGGQPHLMLSTRPAVVRVDEANGVLVPVSSLGVASNTIPGFGTPNGSGTSNYPTPWEAAANYYGYSDVGSAPKTYSWADADEDGAMDPEEFTLYPCVTGTNSPFSGHVDSNFNYVYSNDADTIAYYRVPLDGWIGSGGTVPTWDWADLVNGPAMPDLERFDDYTFSRGIYQDASGNVYQTIMGNVFGEKYTGFWPASEVGTSTLLKWDPSGNLLAAVGEQGLSRSDAGTGVLFYPVRILGEVSNAISILDRTAQGSVFWTTDGLYVGSVFDHRADDGLADEVYSATGPFTVIPDDCLTGDIVELANGDVYFFGPGIGSHPVYKITGFDSLATQSGTVTVATSPYQPSKTGDGLTGHYFSDADLSTLEYTQIDATVNFDWGSGAPDGMPADNWSASWTGEFEPKFSEVYTFTADVNSDDAVRVYIGDTLAIDAWAGGGGSATLYLEAGRQYPIRVEFRDDGGDAKMILRHESTSQRLHSVQQPGLYSAPAGWWRFEESVGNSAQDSSGNANEGTINGGVTRADGQFGDGVNFNGTDGFVRVLGATELSPSNAITVSARVKSDTATWNDDDCLVSMDSAYMLSPIAGTKTLAFKVYDGTAWHTASFTLTHDLTEWHLYTGIYDGSNVMLYVDGQLQASTAFNGTIASDLAPLYIGSHMGISQFFDGEMDDVRVYGRALSANEVNDLQRDLTARPRVHSEIVDDFAHEDGPDTAVFRITRDGPTTSPLTVNYTMGGSAVNGSDYATLPGSVVIPAGSNSVDILVVPSSDGVSEIKETIALTISTDSAYTVGTVTSGTIASFVRLYDPSAPPLGETEGFDTSGTWTDGFGNQFLGDAAKWSNSNHAGGAATGEVKASFWRTHDLVTGYWDESLDREIVWNAESILGGSGRITIPYAGISGTNMPLRFIGFASDAMYDWDGAGIGLAMGINQIGIGVYQAGGEVGINKFDGVNLSGDFLNKPIDFQFQWDPTTLALTATLTPQGGSAESLSLTLTAAEYTSFKAETMTKFGVIGFQHNISPYSGSFSIAADDLTYSSPIPGASVPKVSIDASDPTIDEVVGDQGVFTIRRVGGDIRTPLTVYYSAGGSADSSDYSETLSGSVVIPAGEFAATVVVTPVNDGLIEGDETLELTLTPDAAYDIGTTSDSAVIADSGDLSEPVLDVLATDALAFEEWGDVGQFVITRTGDPTATLTVNYSISGTASAADTVEVFSGTVTMPFGVMSKTFTMTPVNDALAEGAENVILRILPGVGYTVGSFDEASVTIIDDDMTLTPIQNTAALVGNVNYGSLSYFNDLDEDTISGYVRTTDDQYLRTYGYDFGGVVANPTIKIHQDTENGARARVETVNVYTSSGVETFSGLPDHDEITLYLEGVTSFVLVEHVASHDNVAETNVGITELVVSAGPIKAMTNHSLSATITVNSPSWNYGGPTSLQDGLHWSGFYNQNEIDASGHVNPGQEVVFDFGSAVTTRSLGLGLVGDHRGMLKDFILEFATDSNFSNIAYTETLSTSAANQYHAYDLDSAVTAQFARLVPLTVRQISTSAPTLLGLTEVQFFEESVATYQSLPQVNLEPTDASASEVGPDAGEFTVTRTGDTSNALTVYYTASGSASSADYAETLGGWVVIPAGASSTTITITPIDDSTSEDAETILLSLTDDPGYLIGAGAAGTVTIEASDIPTVTILATDDSASEPGTDTGQFTITRSSATSDMSEPLTVNYSVSGTASYIPPITTIAEFNATNTTAYSSQWLVGQQIGYVGYNGQIGYIVGSDAYNPAVYPSGNAGNQFGFLLTDDPSGEYDPAAPQRLAAISSLTISGDFGGGRAGLKDVTLYYGNSQSMQITLPATPGSQTYTFSNPIVTSYIYLTAEAGSYYVNELGFGGDLNIGINAVTFDGFWGDALTNVNYGATVTTTGGSAAGADSLLNDGTVFYSGTGTGRYWTRNADTDLVTMTYTESKTIGSIGLGLSLDADYRAQMSQVTISYDGGSEVIDLRAANLSYGVYELAAPVTTDFLTLTFPNGTAPSGWFLEGTDPNYGVTEFQAFEPVASVTAGNEVDYEGLLSGSVVIPAGETSVTLPVNPIDDSTYEGTETAVVTLEPGSLYAIGSQSSDTVTILDNEVLVSTVTITASDPIASESGADAGQLTIWRTLEIPGPLTVNYTISGTASSGDYTETLSGSVVIPENETSATITITPVDDSDIEYDETVTITLSTGAFYQLGPNSAATVTIGDNDLPTVTIVASDASASETGPDAGQFIVSRDTTLSDLTVEYTISGSASSLDYSDTFTGSVVIPAGQTSIAISVTPFDDLAVESSEDLTLTLVDTADYHLGTQVSDTVTIADAVLPTLSIIATDANAAELNADTATFSVTRAGDTSESLTFEYQVTGTASSGDIQEALGGTGIIPAGQTWAAITITPVDDLDVEGMEDLILTLIPSTGGVTSTMHVAGWFRGGEKNDTDPNTALDSSGHNLTLSAYGAPQQEVSSSAVAGSTGAFQFQGSLGAEAFGTTDATSARPATTATDNFVMEAWVNPQNIAFSGEQAIVSNGCATGGFELLLYQGEWAIHYPWRAIHKYGAAAENAWTHLALVRDNGTTTMYINGEAQATTFTTEPSVPASDTVSSQGGFSIGARYNGMRNAIAAPFEGLVDEVRVWTFDAGTFDAGSLMTDAIIGAYAVDDDNSSAAIQIADDDGAPAVSLVATDANAAEANTDPGEFVITRAGTTGDLTVNYAVTGTADVTDIQETLTGSITIPDGQSSVSLTVTPVDDQDTEINETVTLTLVAGIDYTLGASTADTVTIVDNDQSVNVTFVDINHGWNQRSNVEEIQISFSGPWQFEQLIAAGTIDQEVQIFDKADPSTPLNWLDSNRFSFLTGSNTLTIDMSATDSNTTMLANGRYEIRFASLGHTVDRSTFSGGVQDLFRLAGDLNGDAIVNLTDLSLLASSWNQANPASDVDGVGNVNLVDLSILAANWGKTM